MGAQDLILAHVEKVLFVLALGGWLVGLRHHYRSFDQSPGG